MPIAPFQSKLHAQHGNWFGVDAKKIAESQVSALADRELATARIQIREWFRHTGVAPGSDEWTYYAIIFKALDARSEGTKLEFAKRDVMPAMLFSNERAKVLALTTGEGGKASAGEDKVADSKTDQNLPDEKAEKDAATAQPKPKTNKTRGNPSFKGDDHVDDDEWVLVCPERANYWWPHKD